MVRKINTLVKYNSIIVGREFHAAKVIRPRNELLHHVLHSISKMKCQNIISIHNKLHYDCHFNVDKLPHEVLTLNVIIDSRC